MSLYLGENCISAGGSSAFKNNNIGEIIQSTIPLTDAGLHLLDGSLISGNGAYSDFYEYIVSLYSSYPQIYTDEAGWQQSVANYGVCGKFVFNTTNRTVRLPKITGFTEGTTDVTALGDLIEAGLPNIKGTFSVSRGDSYHYLVDNITGSFVAGTSINGVGETGSSRASGRTITNFDASRSSSIYGNSSTVQPQSVKVLYYIVIATSTKTNIQVDIDEIATDLNGKADVDLSNMNPTQIVKNTIVSWGIPDYSAGISLNISEESYTAPMDGIICLYVYFGESTHDKDITINGVFFGHLKAYNSGYYTGNGYSIIIPVNKGDIVAGLPTYTTNSPKRVFYPLKGVN